MRKVYLFASALILSGSAFAQLQGDKELLPISRPDGPAQVYLNGDMDRAPGDPIYQDDFSNLFSCYVGYLYKHQLMYLIQLQIHFES